LAQESRKRINGLDKKIFWWLRLQEVGAPVTGKINHQAAVVVLKLPCHGKPVTARAEKTVQKHDARQGWIADSDGVEGDAVYGCWHEEWGRLVYMFLFDYNLFCL
jgi:hypothetical protein